jgi:hypothetical protein
MIWIHLVDIVAALSETHTIALRIKKTDHKRTPFYSVSLGMQNTTDADPDNFRPHIRADLLLSPNGAEAMADLFARAEKAIEADKAAILAAFEAAESKRIQAIAGKRGGDPKANTGLSRFKKKHESAKTNVAAAAE